MRLIRRHAAMLTVLAGMVLAAPAVAAPQPEPFPTRWEFTFKPGPLRMAMVETPGVGVKPYFYMTYAVENHSGRDRVFAPAFELMDDEGGLHRSGRGVPPAVVAEIQRRLANPLIEDQLSIVDTLLQGFENARFGVVVWPAERLSADELTVFASGFSGESTTYETVDPASGETRRNVLRKTRMIRYDVPGDLIPGRTTGPFEAIDAQWVMR